MQSSSTAVFNAPACTKSAVFVLPTGPIVAPAFADADEEFKYWQVMRRWYVPEFRRSLDKLIEKCQVRRLGYIETDFLEEQRDAELESCGRDHKRKCVVNNKYDFLINEYECLQQLAQCKQEEPLKPPQTPPQTPPRTPLLSSSPSSPAVAVAPGAPVKRPRSVDEDDSETEPDTPKRRRLAGL